MSRRIERPWTVEVGTPHAGSGLKKMDMKKGWKVLKTTARDANMLMVKNIPHTT